MSEFGKEIAKAGLLALLLNPLTLLILLIVGIIFLAISIGLIIYYGLTTAITFFILSAAAILLLHYIKAVDLTKQPAFVALPFIMAIIGYFGERLRMFSIQPLWATQQPAVAIQPQILLILVLLLIIGVAVAGRRKT